MDPKGKDATVTQMFMRLLGFAQPRGTFFPVGMPLPGAVPGEEEAQREMQGARIVDAAGFEAPPAPREERDDQKIRHLKELNDRFNLHPDSRRRVRDVLNGPMPLFNFDVRSGRKQET